MVDSHRISKRHPALSLRLGPFDPSASTVDAGIPFEDSFPTLVLWLPSAFA
jgi:hypothetical protein